MNDTRTRLKEIWEGGKGNFHL